MINFRIAAYITVLMALAVATGAAQLPAGETNLTGQQEQLEIIPVDEAFRFEARWSDEGLELNWRVTPGHYLYRHTFEIRLEDGAAVTLDLPAGKARHDEFFGDVEIYETDLFLTVPASRLGGAAEVEVRYQGCAEIGYCYPPQKKQLNVAKLQGS